MAHVPSLIRMEEEGRKGHTGERILPVVEFEG